MADVLENKTQQEETVLKVIENYKVTDSVIKNILLSKHIMK